MRCGPEEPGVCLDIVDAEDEENFIVKPPDKRRPNNSKIDVKILLLHLPVRFNRFKMSWWTTPGDRAALKEQARLKMHQYVPPTARDGTDLSLTFCAAAVT